MKIKIKVAESQMHENLHKNMNEIFMSFMKGNLSNKYITDYIAKA